MAMSSTVIVLLSTALGVFGLTFLARRALSGVGEFEIAPWTSSLSYVATAYGVVLGFSVIFLFGEYAEARKAVGNEAAAIQVAFDEAQLFPDARPEIERALLCYSASVVEYDWPALEDGRGSPETDRAYRELFATLSAVQEPTDGTFQPATATNLVAQVGSISTAREVRVVAARVHTPPLLWVLLVFGGSLVIVLLFVVTLRAHMLAQAGLVAVAAVFTEVMLLIVLALGAPFDAGAGRLSPTLIEGRIASMEQTVPGLEVSSCTFASGS